MFYSKIKKANEEFSRRYLLKSLNPFFQEIFENHTSEEIEKQFDSEAQIMMNELEERVNCGVLESNAAMVVDES